MNNFNLNDALPLFFGSFNASALPRSNRPLYLSKSSIIPDNPGFIIVSSAEDWIEKGGSVTDNEYKMLYSTFIGFDMEEGNLKPVPESVIMAKRRGNGNPGYIMSGNVADNIVVTITGNEGVAALPITFNFGGTPILLTIDATGLTSESMLAGLIQIALRAFVATDDIQLQTINKFLRKKIKSLKTAMFPNATCTFNPNGRIFTVSTDTAPNAVTVDFCTGGVGQFLATTMKLVAGSGAEVSNGATGMTADQNMNYILNKQMMSFACYKTCYEIDALPEEYLGLCKFSKQQRQKYNFDFSFYSSNSDTIMADLVSNGYLEQYTDNLGVSRYRMAKDCAISFNFLYDEVDATGEVQSQPYAPNSVVVSTVVACNNPFAATNSSFRNINGAGFVSAGLTPAIITQQQYDKLLKYGGVAYASYAGNTGVFAEAAGSGRNSRDSIFVDLWANNTFAGYRLQYALNADIQAGTLTQAAASVTTQSTLQDLAIGGYYSTNNKLDYRTSPTDRKKLTEIAILFGFGSDNIDMVQESLNTNGYVYNVLPYTDLSFEQIQNITFIHLNGNRKDDPYVLSIVEELSKRKRFVIAVNEMYEDRMRDIDSHPKRIVKFKNEDGSTSDKSKVVVVNYLSIESGVHDRGNYLETYVPNTLREKGLIDFIAVMPQESFNKITIFYNQVN